MSSTEVEVSESTNIEGITSQNDTLTEIKDGKKDTMLQSNSVDSSSFLLDEEHNHNTKHNFDSSSEDEGLKVSSSRSIVKKRVALLDSDSEDSTKPSGDIDKKGSCSDSESEITSLTLQSKSRDVHSESDEQLNINSYRKETNGKLKRKKIIVEDSDSEDEPITQHNIILSGNNQPQESPIYTNDFIQEHQTPKAPRYSALCDSESSSDEISPSDDNESEEERAIIPEQTVRKYIPRRKRTNKEQRKSERLSKKVTNPKEVNEPEKVKEARNVKEPKPKKGKEPKKMTAKQAAKQRIEIRSESQRMTRETNISLPYHRPKSHSLREFLARRPKLASAVPLVAKTPPSVAIKMSVEQLEVITQKLEERHKEVKEFYKSDSEPEVDEEENNDVENSLNLENTVNTIPDKSNIDLNKECAGSEVVEEENNDVEDSLNVENTVNTIPEKSDADLNKECADSFMQNVGENGDDLVLNVLVKDKEFEDSGIQTSNENDSKTIDDNSADKKDNEKLDLMEVDCSSDNVQESVVSESTLSNADVAKENSINSVVVIKDVDCLHADGLSTIQSINNSVLGTNQENVETNKPLENRITGVDEQSEEQYEFNLDDVYENSEKLINSDGQNELEHQNHQNRSNNDEHFKNSSSENQKQTMDFSELDKEIENFTRDSSEAEKQKPSKIDLLKERLSNIQPRLSNTASNIIDLDNIAKPKQVVQLMERFAKHNAKKEHHKDKIKFNIVSVENGGEIHKETVAVYIDDEEDTAIEEKPGVRLQRLRNELQTQIAQQKQQLWENKLNKGLKTVVDDDDPYQDEKSECGADDDILDNDEEEELTESSENEDDEEETDGAIVDKPKKDKSAYIDDEAAESDIEDEEYNEYGNENEEDDADNEEEMDENEDDNSDKENEVEQTNENENKENEYDETTAFKKPLRRIIKGFAEDSDDDNDDDIQLSSVVSKIAEKLNKSNEESNSTTQEDYIPSYQLQNQKTPIRETLGDKSNFDGKFLTPVSYITGLQNLTNSASKIQSPTNVPSPLRDSNWHTAIQKKLFADSVITNSQAEDMAQLCSERFSDSQASTQDNLTTNSSTENYSMEVAANDPPTSQDLNELHEEPTTQDLLNICSGEFSGTTQEPSNTISKTCINHILNPVEEVKSLDEDQDMVISQLLNEEEMEAFKKKFDSPILMHSQKVIEDTEEVAATGGVIDSDDDENTLEVKKRKNQKKLTFSDDDSTDEEEEDNGEQEEEINLHDEDELDDEDVEAEINYDSEENEIELVGENEREKIKLSDFFENEAELSESEWGSADEDEKDLDRLDFEQGDEEKFDEKQMRTDLERIHMRRMLDDDTREVKLLQEMLLDDGELHGSGRERQFKWKNIDSQDTADDTRINSDEEVGFDEEESEEQWRRKRHEREMFLKEKQSQIFNDDSDLLSRSEILKFGHKVIQKSLNNSQGNAFMEKTKVDNGSPSLKTNFGLLHKRGSFLSRGDQVLQKVAEYNKLSSTTTTTVAQKAKNSKSFLFQSVEVQAVNEKMSIFSKKRKAIEGTPKVIKKLRLTDNFSPAVKKKSKPNAKSQLFGVS